MSTAHTAPLHGAVTQLSPADAIALWMDHFELSESDVADLTGLPVNTVTRLRRGSQRITEAIAEALAGPTSIPASRWLAVQRHYAVWTQGVDCALAALRGPRPSLVHDHDQESTMDQPQTAAPEIPLYGTAATIRQFAERLNISGGTIGTATVLRQLAAMMRNEGITYLAAADLDHLADAVHPALAGEPGTPAP